MPSSSSARPSRPSRLRTAAVALAATAVALATGACRVDVRVGIDSHPDGSGDVRVTAELDRAAVAQLVGRAAGDPDTVDPATRIKVDDLRAAGWTVTTSGDGTGGTDGTGDTDGAGGGLQVVARHHFADAAEARRLVDEVGGDPGPFRDVRLRQQRTFLRTTTTFEGIVDLSARLGAFTDPDLATALEATPDAPLGVTEAQLEHRLGAAIDRLFGLHVAVRLPGDVTSNAPSQTSDGAVWTPKLGERVTLEATSRRWNVGNLVALAVAVAAALALVVVVLRGRRRLTVTDSNIMVPVDGETGADEAGA